MSWTYDAAWPHITQTLERLCDKYGFETVLGVFANDMPDHRRDRKEQLEREKTELRTQKRKKPIRRVKV